MAKPAVKKQRGYFIGGVRQPRYCQINRHVGRVVSSGGTMHVSIRQWYHGRDLLSQLYGVLAAHASQPSQVKPFTTCQRLHAEPGQLNALNCSCCTRPYHQLQVRLVTRHATRHAKGHVACPVVNVCQYCVTASHLCWSSTGSLG